MAWKIAVAEKKLVIAGCGGFALIIGIFALISATDSQSY
jgi:NADH:ubiquinone oxidoreductase subunit 5 (subunit L)/multisubunit Na+/H+ antiporter MnhA subunit